MKIENSTMTWKQFYKSYLELSNKVPSYRLGQHFINVFIKDESVDSELAVLWSESNQVLAINQCLRLIEQYQWDMEALPIVQRVLIKEA